MITFKKTALLLLCMAYIFACGQTEEPLEPEPETEIETPVVLEYGTISGIVTDAGTGNPIPGATVTLLEVSMATGLDGSYSFQNILYNDAHTLVVEDVDYKPYSESFALNQERLVVNIELEPLKDPVLEIHEFFDNFSDLLESLDVENIEAIRALFSETYVAADDAATLFGVASGIIPENYEDVVPAMTQLFEEYVSLEFSVHGYRHRCDACPKNGGNPSA